MEGDGDVAMPHAAPVEGTTERPRCPACRVELRIRDDKGTDPVFACPECQTPLRLDRNDAGLLIVVLAQSPPVPKAAALKKPVRRPAPTTVPKTERPDHSLLLFGAGAAIVTLLILSWLILKDRTEVTVTPPAEVPITDVPESTPPVAELDPLEERLTKLAEQIRAHFAETTSFPTTADATSSLPVAQQFSWLARLEARNEALPTERKPLFSKPWNDPVNEPFVGRRITDYLNPSLGTMVGDDGRPATHFAGVAGVGRDAADLPSGHPRAGMFGTKRTTTVQDVRDGLANVVMVLGVESQLGSWADPGRATVRPLTSPPYLHGPDGFGGGTGKPLPALMADGSVRLFAADTDPALLRRLAAIADGLPLDLKVPGEPGDVSPATSPPVQSVAVNDPDNPPVSALTAITAAQRPAIVRPPVAPLLQQPLTSFQQTKPVSRRELLTIAADLLGRPVVFDQENLGPVTEQLDAKVTFSLTDTTVAGVLEQLLNGTELELAIGPEQATVRQRTVGATSAIRLEP